MTLPTSTTIAAIGGTGKEGRGLALRLAAAGFPVIIGSRQQTKAGQMVTCLNEALGAQAYPLRGTSNRQAAAQADVIIFVVPYSAQKDILADIRESVLGKTIITAVVPLDPANIRRILVPPDGSAAAEIQRILGAETPVVTAFQNISAYALQDWNRPIDCDILICGDNDAAKRTAMELVRSIEMRPIDAGPLANAAAVEGLTAILIGLNMRHRVRGAGIRITGLP